MVHAGDLKNKRCEDCGAPATHKVIWLKKDDLTEEFEHYVCAKHRPPRGAEYVEVVPLLSEEAQYVLSGQWHFLHSLREFVTSNMPDDTDLVEAVKTSMFAVEEKLKDPAFILPEGEVDPNMLVFELPLPGEEG